MEAESDGFTLRTVEKECFFCLTMMLMDSTVCGSCGSLGASRHPARNAPKKAKDAKRGNMER